MQNKKMFIFDLDGTLLNDKKQITAQSTLIIEKIKKFDNYITIATGRHFHEVIDILNKYNFTCWDYLITSDGMYIYDTNGIIYTNSTFNFTEVKNILESNSSARISIISSVKDYIIIMSITDIIKSFLSWAKNSRCEYIFKFQKNKLKNIFIEKIVITPILRDENNKKKEEILPNNCNKYKTIKYLLSMMNIKEEDVIYFGDDINDIDCFKNFKETVAMGNSIAEVKKIAKYITLSNNEEGIFKYLNSHCQVEEQ